MREESPALTYWLDELTNKGEETKRLYTDNFKKFCAFVNKTPDELITQRQEDAMSRDMKIQRRIESLFKAFLADQEKKGYAIASLQVMFASVRSFFETHYFPLRMRKGDYPKGDSDGVRKASKDAILKALHRDTAKRPVLEKALILLLKDSGLRVSDARLLNCGFILEETEKNPQVEFIQLNVKTKKTKLLAKTFIGKEAIDAILDYIEARRKGTRYIKPEAITKDSPLFKIWTKGNVQRMPRTSMSTLITQAFNAIGEKRMSAHSLRKKLQTDLEEANVNVNWIDQILGHELINSRGAYSKPSDEQLREAYMNAYDKIRIYPAASKPASEANTTAHSETPTINQPVDLIAQLLTRGYEVTMKPDGTMAFKMPAPVQ